jgi:hypothetical protein
MAKKLWVAIHKENTQANQMDDTDLRKDKLEDAVDAAYPRIEQLANAVTGFNLAKAKQSALCLFVAPEYLFAQETPSGERDHAYGMERQLDEMQKVAIETFIKNLSSTHRGMILIPGSVAWKKPLQRDANTYLRRKELLAGKPLSKVKKMFLRAGHATKHSRTAKAKKVVSGHAISSVAGPKPSSDGVYAYADWCSSCNDLVDVDSSGTKCADCGSTVKEEAYLWCKVCGIPVKPMDDCDPGDTCSKCPRLLIRGGITRAQTLHMLGQTTAVEMSRNTAYVDLNGKRHLKYYKQAGFHEVLTEDGSNVFVAGAKQPSVNVAGIRIGLEICFDHAVGALRTPAGKASNQRPDIHVILSASVQMDDTNLHVKQGGWIVHASSEANFNKVFQNAGTATNPQTATGETPVVSDLNGNVDIYLLEV